MSIGNSGSFFNNFQGGAFFQGGEFSKGGGLQGGAFNSGTGINNVNPAPAGNAALNPLKNLVPAPLQQNSSQPLLNVLPNTKAQLESAVKEIAAMDENQTMTAVKDLLKFPEQFSKLVSQLTVNMKLTNQETALLMLAAKMNLPQLQQALSSSSKEALSNLYKMLADYSRMGVSMKNEQLSKLAQIISFVQASSSSDTGSLKTVMLMYLPWLPLQDPDAFRLEIGTASEEGAAIGLDSIGVLISTVNYGNLQAQILKTEEDGIKIEVISSETFPLKEFAELMKEESRRYNININMDFAQKKDFNKENISKPETKVFLNTSPGVNPFLLVISNALIKNAHEIDISKTAK